jgi:DNA polymerase-3 subunit chi
MALQADFYILAAESGSTEEYATRLVDKIYRMGLSVLILAGDQPSAQRLDETLWRQEGFLPHTLLPGGEQDRIRVCTSGTMAGGADVLLNLAGDMPPRLEGFSRIAEIVPASPDAREQSRRNYRCYQEKGYSIKTHQIGGQVR